MTLSSNKRERNRKTIIKLMPAAVPVTLIILQEGILEWQRNGMAGGVVGPTVSVK